ncbi:hypothetical protein [Psychrobacillus vulpis]|uniref:Uncharacterized protein n=1 Tax=Psychrobacillus vulpis TaxID=2325572 RepID=A0A544TTD3_9BACI|nr:hypothetical protein [Psychrobacillus vulpis]TQR20716.1 hypothetical protein FG384_06390 [Psychrobacillus vulpis]
MFEYKNFKEKVANMQFNFRSDGYIRVIAFISDVYKEENILAFYFKNGVNEKKKELFFIFKESILKVSKIEDADFLFEHYSKNIVKKKFTTSKFTGQSHELVLTFENGEQLVFNNIEDSNHDWAAEYTESIKEIYKYT